MRLKKSSNFLDHGHDPRIIDYVVYMEEDIKLDNVKVIEIGVPADIDDFCDTDRFGDEELAVWTQKLGLDDLNKEEKINRIYEHIQKEYEKIWK